MEGFEDYREDYEAMSPEELDAQYGRLTATLQAHPAYLVHQEWTALWRSFDIFTGNMTDLRALLNSAETDEELMTELFQNVREPAVRTAYFRALDRVLHNALAGAVSLVDHARRHVKQNFSGSDFDLEFEARNTTVFEMPEAVFLRRFRNYLLHVGHAPFKMTGTLAVKDEDKNTLTILLVSEELLEVNDMWTGAAKQFIEAHPDGIHLRSVAESYWSAMLDLYKWVFDQQPILNPDALGILNEFTRRINLTMTAGAHDGRHMQEFWEHVSQNAKARREGRPQTDWQDVKPKD